MASDFFFSHEKVSISDLRFLPFFVSLLCLLSTAVTAYYMRLVSVCLVVKMVLAVQRSCPVLISMCVSLALALKEWLASSKDLAVTTVWSSSSSPSKGIFFFKQLELDWINRIAGIFLWWPRLWPSTFSGLIPTHLDLQWDRRNFYPEHFLKTPPCIICNAFWYIGCLCRIHKLRFGLIQKLLPPYQSRILADLHLPQQNSKGSSRPEVI